MKEVLSAEDRIKISQKHVSFALEKLRGQRSYNLIENACAI